MILWYPIGDEVCGFRFHSCYNSEMLGSIVCYSVLVPQPGSRVEGRQLGSSSVGSVEFHRLCARMVSYMISYIRCILCHSSELVVSIDTSVAFFFGWAGGGVCDCSRLFLNYST